jgi:hypothetical protein
VPFTWAYTTVVNRTQTSVTLNQAELLGPSPELQTLSVWVAPTGHPAELHVNSPVFHKLPFMRGVAGFQVAPREAYILVFELEVPANGAYTTQGVSLSYTDGGKAFRITYSDLVRVCAPRSLTVPCSGPSAPAAST